MPIRRPPSPQSKRQAGRVKLDPDTYRKSSMRSRRSRRRGGEVKIEWVKAHMGILGNEAADVVAKNVAEGVPPDGGKRGHLFTLPFNSLKRIKHE